MRTPLSRRGTEAPKQDGESKRNPEAPDSNQNLRQSGEVWEKGEEGEGAKGR